MKFLLGYVLPLAVCVFNIIVCPYTKVEESFNMQYDHHEFPGVVPRTFIGAMTISAMSIPYKWAIVALGLSRFWLQYAVRGSLAILVCGCLYRFVRSFSKEFGEDAATTLVWVCAAQFHLFFYASRTLPNTFAVALVMSAIADWMGGRYRTCVFQLVAAAVWFRCDMVLLLGTIGITLLLTRKMSIVEALLVGIGAAVMCIGITVAIDSVMWRRVLWPEGEVLWFNTVMNQSHKWGTQPWHWYFSSALPRAMLGTSLFVPVGALTRVNPAFSIAGVGPDRRMLPLLAPVVAFIAMYSFLPHKELRFILPALIVLNAVAAYGFAKLLRMRRKTTTPAVAGLFLLFVTFLLSRVFLAASEHNYPGGVALHTLHTKVYSADATLQSLDVINVHIDAASAMQGITRFGELGGKWRYSKDESLKVADDFTAFDVCITADPKNLEPYFKVVEPVDGFTRVNWRMASIQRDPKLWITRRTDTAAPA